MKVREIIEDARSETNTSTAQVNDEKALKKLNKVYQSVRRMIVRTQEDYFWNYWTTDLQKGATEYSIQRKEVEENGIKISGIAKIRAVEILNGEKYEELKELSDKERRSGMHGYILADNHIILNFDPKENKENGLKIVGIQAINNLTIDDEEDAIFPGHEDLRDFLSVIQKGLAYEMRKEKQDFEKANYAMQERQNEISEMIRRISHRTQKIYLTNLSY